ncbi:DUF1538 domain-containing protein [uncultured Desulfovibrio sp.]|uniref:DUF1538 domain-containing protein n=1 Tax=uncultured Desulfovibrio sp. TaxID=167968 RepID=UPI00208559CD|nr:DUF1538 domain-containing protein [uncultured Desulfovibrio sp.]GKG93611.1 membrane protein [Desulfovibrionaceae bacterium]GKI12163.1 membrane protein [Desulfovibrionaceae bacterium]
MVLLEKIKESAISVIPVMLVVCLLHFTAAPLGDALGEFLVGGVLLILGLSVFLLGADIGVLPVGQKAGSALTSRRNLPLLLGAGFVIGFFITVAEPDVHVLAQQVSAVDPGLSRPLLVLMIAVGVGLFVAIALGRIILQVSLRLLLLLFYLLLFGCAALTSSAFLGVAFDAGGATTGPMTVPFIMALGVGVAAVRGGRGKDDSFGLIGLASIGPVLSVLILGMLHHGRTGDVPEAIEAQASTLLGHFLALVPEVAGEVGMALGPLVGLFVIFRIFLLRLTRYQTIRMAVGLVYTFLGLVCFFVGVKGGFIPAGRELGGILAQHDFRYFLILAGVVLGALAVCAEPAVWVLNAQVEEVSGGHIKRTVMLVSLCIGVAAAVGMAMLRVVTGMSIWWFLIPGYVLALGLTLFCPRMFTAIAFDSGGVASGPMASTFILAFTLGASHSLGGNPITDAFGVIAMIAMTPLITIQVLGILVDRREKAAARRRDALREPASRAAGEGRS